MCRECVKEEYPDRGRTCLEKGCYLFNFISCTGCGKKEVTQINHNENNEADEEVITFEHACSHCGHVVASHVYNFTVSDGYQEYSMDCLLCGTAEDEQSVLPDDPRKYATIF